MRLDYDAYDTAEPAPQLKQAPVMLPHDQAAAKKLQPSMAGAGAGDAGHHGHPAGRRAHFDTSQEDARQQQTPGSSQWKVRPAEQVCSPGDGAVQSQGAFKGQAGIAEQAAREKGAHSGDSGGWSWRTGWLPTAALQQVAAGAASPPGTCLHVIC